jgi:hypothetical protein
LAISVSTVILFQQRTGGNWPPLTAARACCSGLVRDEIPLLNAITQWPNMVSDGQEGFSQKIYWESCTNIDAVSNL